MSVLDGGSECGYGVGEKIRDRHSTVNLAPCNWASNSRRRPELQWGCNTQLNTHTENTDHIWRTELPVKLHSVRHRHFTAYQTKSLSSELEAGKSGQVGVVSNCRYINPLSLSLLFHWLKYELTVWREQRDFLVVRRNSLSSGNCVASLPSVTFIVFRVKNIIKQTQL